MNSKIHWDGDQSFILHNPSIQLGSHEKSLSDLLPDHIWLTTSGTTAARKWVGLSKTAVLTSAAAVNRHLGAQASDRWLNYLPVFHVGGLGIFARAHLSGAAVVDLSERRWSVADFLTALEGVTLTSLVATQVYDLVNAKAHAPSTLRAVIVGGGALSDELYEQAKGLGWRLLPSYGLTECASQVATAKLTGDSPALELLDHVECRLDSTGRLSMRSQALFSGYAAWVERNWVIQDPKFDGWFTTEDRAELHMRFLKPLGRVDDQVKISGELVDIAKLQLTLDALKFEMNLRGEAMIVICPDERRGNQLDLVVSHIEFHKAKNLQYQFNQRVLGYERATCLYILKQIPRTQAGKVQRLRLLELLGL
jgi:o-succinylbenzoate---CoA ligase